MGSTGHIHRYTISTDDKNYVCHTDTEVWIKDTYTNLYGDDEEGIVTRSRLFETVRQERIDAYKEEIARYQKDLAVFENSKNYDHYWELVYKNR